MCDPVSVIGGASLVMGAVSARKQSKAYKRSEARQRAQTAEQAKLDAEHAANIKEQAAQEARKIRAEAIKIRGNQVAQQANSGVLVGNGSTQAMVDETTRLAEQDAYLTLYNGEKGYLFTMDQSRLTQMEGRARAESYGDKASASLLGGAARTLGDAYTLLK